jgi:DNA/RNA-binding domain of Phe-tRNA-synthetase-like protein
VLHSRYSLDAQRGRIRGVTLRRIRTLHDRYNTVSLIGGFDAEHLVEDVRLEDVRIGEQVIASPDDLHLFTRHARGITATP